MKEIDLHPSKENKDKWRGKDRFESQEKKNHGEETE